MFNLIVLINEVLNRNNSALQKLLKITIIWHYEFNSANSRLYLKIDLKRNNLEAKVFFVIDAFVTKASVSLSLSLSLPNSK